MAGIAPYEPSSARVVIVAHLPSLGSQPLLRAPAQQ